MKSFAEMVESAEKETPGSTLYKLIQSRMGYGGDDEKIRAISEDLTVCLSKFIGSFKKEIYSLSRTASRYLYDYWGLCNWPDLDLKAINNWDEFFAAIESHPDKTEIVEYLNDEENNFNIFRGEDRIMGGLDILKKVHELDPNILDKKIPFNQEPAEKPEPFFKQLSDDDLRAMGFGSLVDGFTKIHLHLGRS